VKQGNIKPVTRWEDMDGLGTNVMPFYVLAVYYMKIARQE